MLNQNQSADFLWNQILLGINKIKINNYKSKFIELNLSFIMKSQLIAIKTRLENLKIILNNGGLKFVLPKWIKEYNPRLFTKCVICFADRKKSKIYDHYQLDKVSKLLSGYGEKLAMIDFETINDPQPNIVHYLPYDRIVVQISMHLMKKNQIVDHYEYIVKDLSLNELMKIANILLIAQNKGYDFVAYNKVFENSCINKMNSILNTKINNVNLDLADFFVKRSIKKEKKAPISLISFGFSFSIKVTINYYSSINPYQNLEVNNGFDAMAKLYNYIVEKDMSINLKTLYKYCKQDTKTMVDLYNKINYEYHLYVTGQKSIIKSNFPFEKS